MLNGSQKIEPRLGERIRRTVPRPQQPLRPEHPEISQYMHYESWVAIHVGAPKGDALQPRQVGIFHRSVLPTDRALSRL